MYGQPDLPLGIEHAAQVTPGHGKIWLGFNCLQVTSLQQVNSKKQNKKKQEEEEVERRTESRQRRDCKSKETKRSNKKEERTKRADRKSVSLYSLKMQKVSLQHGHACAKFCCAKLHTFPTLRKSNQHLYSDLHSSVTRFQKKLYN